MEYEIVSACNYVIHGINFILFVINLTPKKPDVRGVFPAKSIVRSERVKALKGSMPRESLIAPIKSTHLDSFLSLARLSRKVFNPLHSE